MFYDAHLHNKNKENGGLLIGLEGIPIFKNTLNNKEVLNLHNPEKNYISFYYVQKSELNKKISHKYLKYHPRREKYTVKDVIKSISINLPKCIIIDTLNEPNWIAYDYWEIAQKFPELPIIFAHAGGYLINDFLKICHFQKNVWLDFSATQNILGHLENKKEELPYINQGIKYALNSPFKNKILLSSDFPFFSQKEIYEFYKKLNAIDLLNNNFIKLKELIL